MTKTKELYKWLNEHIWITVTILAFILITLGSRESFLYSFNFEGDINIYKTIGRGMLEGMVPYRDLFDHKGPYVYLLFMVLELWEPSVYLLEIVICAISLYYAYKIMQLYKEQCIINLVVFGIIVYFSVSFHSGGTVEEFFFPMELYITYLGLKYIKDNQRITNKQFLLIGIYGGLILWSKFTILGFFIGWCIVPFILMIKQKKYKEFVQGMGMIIWGVLLVTLPAFGYLISKGAFSDFLQAYFIDNMYYASGDGIFINIISAVVTFMLYKKHIIILIMLFVSAVFIKKQMCLEKLYFVIMALFMVTFTFCGGRCHSQYFLPFYIFMIFGAMQIKNNVLGYVLSAVIILVSIVNSSSLPMIGIDTKETIQYEFSEIMGEKENPTLLMYNTSDFGFYDMANITPNCKYFFKCNIKGLAQTERDEYLEGKKVEFYICLNEPVIFNGYELRMKRASTFNDNQVYYLYQLKE